MKHVLFSTTRQWNPGDEFILTGVRRIFDELGFQYNPMIYNRHPDIRSQSGDFEMFRRSRVPGDFNRNVETRFLEANIKFGFFDNSFKPRMEGGCLDLAVLAGTPEWCSGRMVDFYEAVRAHHVPLLALGIGGDYEPYDPRFVEVIRKAKLITVRDEATRESLCAHGLEAQRLPCPALLAAPTKAQRSVGEVRRVGLIYQARAADTVIWNGLADASYDRMMRLLRAAFAVFRGLEIEVVCHCADEVELAMREFPGSNIRYSYDSADYIAIYAHFDLVVGSRVHGVGLAASLGVPGVALAHDRRGATTEGFLASLLRLSDDPAGDTGVVEQAASAVHATSQRLAEHKEQTLASYKRLVGEALEDAREIRYEDSPKPPALTPDVFELSQLSEIYTALRRVEFGIDRRTGDDTALLLTMIREVRDRTVNIEHKLNASLRLV